MDLVFMDCVCMLWFGYGLFLLCLESLYKVWILFFMDIFRYIRFLNKLIL